MPNMKSSLKLGLIVLLFTIPYSLFSQQNKWNKISKQNQTNFKYLGVLINPKPGSKNKLLFDHPQVISLIGCLDCEIKASTIFEGDLDKKVYLDTSEFKVKKIKDGVMINDCMFESSFLAKNAVVITLSRFWAPIAPITLEFYRSGVKLPLEREFKLEY
jgi:hypothetical protein